jgi:hypothetical protein
MGTKLVHVLHENINYLTNNRNKLHFIEYLITRLISSFKRVKQPQIQKILTDMEISVIREREAYYFKFLSEVANDLLYFGH